MAPRKTRTSKRVKTYANRAIKSSRHALLRDVCEGMYKEFLHNKNRLPYGHVSNLLKELKPQETWLTRNIINKSFMNYREEMKQKLPVNTQQPSDMHSYVVGGSNIGRISPLMLSDLSNVSSLVSSQKVGRPLGSTEAFKELAKKT